MSGFRGSKLYNVKKKSHSWLSITTPFLPNSKENIDLPLNIIADEPDDVIADGILEEIGFIKFYKDLIVYIEELSQQHYKSYLRENRKSRKSKLMNDSNESLQQHQEAQLQNIREENGKEQLQDQQEGYKPPFKLHKFSYDWRRSNTSTTNKFLEFLRDIYSNNGQKPIYVIAHSNGGLITLSALHQQPELFAGCIFAGSLFHGAPGILHTFKYGDNILFNKRIHDEAAHFTLRSAYHFLPAQYDKVFKDSVSGEYLSEFDYFDVDCWKNCQLSNLERADYLKMVLDDTKAFHETLKLPKDKSINYPPLATIVSDSHSATSGFHVKLDDDGNKFTILYDQPIRVKGDGAVPFTSTRLPDGIPYDVFHTTRVHSELLQDLVTVGKAIERVFGKKEVVEEKIL
ncbi:7082_t:CDS:2 [Entrophospora sp. SA101]|nr:15627_t:CDS:2 [Entrophospora sp. SA101]CAJ0899497.1 7082_t:CDS:2 [Entrophospora sp. SA101]